jgi:hypothetical protein
MYTKGIINDYVYPYSYDSRLKGIQNRFSTDTHNNVLKSKEQNSGIMAELTNSYNTLFNSPIQEGEELMEQHYNNQKAQNQTTGKSNNGIISRIKQTYNNIFNTPVQELFTDKKPTDIYYEDDDLVPKNINFKMFQYKNNITDYKVQPNNNNVADMDISKFYEPNCNAPISHKLDCDNLAKPSVPNTFDWNLVRH